MHATAEDLVGYFDAVHAQTVDFVGGIGAADLDRIVDESWDPPVTLGVRLVSVITDDIAHAGQAEYVRGIVERERQRLRYEAMSSACDVVPVFARSRRTRLRTVGTLASTAAAIWLTR